MRGEAAPGRTLGQNVGFFLGLGLFLGVLLWVDLVPGKPLVTRMAAVAALMSTWWITDAIPLFATALLPLVLYPCLGIMAGKATAPIYVNSTIFLFLGGFLIALSMEKWNLHRRMALFIIRLVGGGPARIVLGFMLAAAFLSMWISNTATAIMMVPIGMAVISQAEERFGEEGARGFSVCLMLGIAYACSIGGIATLVGTPPNLSFSRIFAITFPKAPPVTFGLWFLLGLPVTIVMLAVIWFLLAKVFFRLSSKMTAERNLVDRAYAALGPMRFEERIVLIVFFLTALLWVFRVELNLGLFTIPGWSQLLPTAKMLDDGTVAMFMATTLFLIPTRSEGADSPRILGADVIGNLPWDIVLLFGGGFALAQGFQATGLSTFIGSRFGALADMPPIVMIVLTCLTLTFLTELTSNTATTEMILPVMAAVSSAMKINPLLLMIPATLSASCAFMMPVATPPNAIVFGSGRVSIPEMARVGVVINFIGVGVITALFYLVGTLVFSIDPSTFPDWAR